MASETKLYFMAS